MKLFLASLASVTMDLVRPLLPGDPKHLKLAYIPTAADPYPLDQRPWTVADRAKAVSMGFQVTDYDIKGKNINSLRKDLSEYDVIFVDGGNTYYLLNQVQKTGFVVVIKELLEHGTVYVGSSAGSCIMCPSISHVELVEHKEVVPELTDFTGIGLVKQRLMPHAGREKYALRHAQIEDLWGEKVTFISDDQALVVNDDKIELVTK